MAPTPSVRLPTASRSAVVLLCVAFLAVSASPTHAARSKSKPKPADAVAELYRLSGLRDQVVALPRVMDAQIASSKDDLPPRAFSALQAAIAEIDTASMDSLCLAELREELSETTTQAALTFLKSPTGRTVTEAERRSSTVEAVQQRIDFQKDHAPETDPARVSLLRALDAATGSAEAYTAVMLAMRYAMAAAFNATRPEAEQQSDDALWALAQQDLAQLRVESQQEILDEYNFAYRAITKDELREYIRFAVSESGLDYNRATMKVMSRLMAGMAKDIAAVTAREFTK